MIENSNKIYFPNLNGIRFIAAFVVIIHHLEQIKKIFGFNNHWENPTVQQIGPLGVVLFFVLSGFLITYLLLVEEKLTKTISIKSFYMRRILRIWPLYYLIILLSFFVLSKISFFNLGEWSGMVWNDLSLKLLFFTLFLPNIALIIFPPVPYASQSWSVGVEEQFYLIWPILIKNVKNKKQLLISIIVGYLIIKIFLFNLLENYIFWNDALEKTREIFNSFSIDCMAIGGLFAVFLFEKNKILKLLFSKYFQVIIFLILAVFILKGIEVPFVNFEFYAVLFGIIIINLAANENTIVNLENKVFHYLGKISYGIYMFHPIAIVLTLKILYNYNISNIFIQMFAAVATTIIISSISYKYFESYFIKKKNIFTKIISGDEAK
ncbi:acyltransferase [Flavobacterium sp. F372]|jgi:peptidoglycan/LPS O-acetylase OafA/YrhL|uniref:Acyltransferase n=1 Tax=Flavobacterium bernardetii TaxID=2813823 RepID=A0ABR7IU85_9FLAO|nr:acyltransferase [Flavobacterium bernardetii]MBC5833320.1 acyltransferase [Flavobacterium bernardetii]NHF68552.1 acyltransferase [Flavobacterium bernardetii]